MHNFRRFIRACFGYAAAVYLFAGIPLISVLFKIVVQDRRIAETGRTFTPDQSFLLVFVKLILLSAPIVGLLNGIAWWTLKTCRRGARLWAIAASLSFLFASAILLVSNGIINRHGIPGHPPAFLGILAIQMFMCFGGLYAFGSRRAQADIVAPAESARIAGDGTGKSLDAIALILQFGGTWALIDVYSRWGYDHDLPFAHGLASWIQWAIVILAVTCIHESAHALVGIAAGMKLCAFIVGPFQFRVREGRWKFEFRPTQILAVSGAAGLTPVDPDQSRWNEVAMIAAGPFANLLTGSVAAALAWSSQGAAWQPWWEYFALFATVSLVAGLVNLIPFRPESLYSDGARIVQLFRRSAAADYHRVAQTVHCTLVSRRRPRDYDIDAIQRASAHFTSGHQALLLRLFATSYYFDRDRLAEASAALAEAERIYRESASDAPADLHTSFIIKGALLGRDPACLREWWNSMQSKKPKTFNQDYWLARSVFHWAENNPEAAREAWNTGDAYLARLPIAGTYNYDRDCYTRIKQILDNPPPETTAAPESAASDSPPSEFLPWPAQ